MSPLPARMIDRWHRRVEPEAGRGTVYWHMLLSSNPQVRDIVCEAQERLAGFSGLHMTPQQWLHMTVLIVGSTEDIPAEKRTDLVAEASRLLSVAQPINVTLGRILYHPEAILLSVHPQHVLHPVFSALQSATRNVLHSDGIVESGHWVPHVTIAYSTAEQPAEPIIAALGRELPAQEITIDNVSLVIQDGPERDWNWHPVGRVDFGTTVTV
jgi:2'-5' RNA ligase